MPESTIRRRGDKWVAVVELPRDPVTHKRRQRWITADTRKEARKRRTELLAEIDKGGLTQRADMSLNDYLARWLEDVRHRVEATSWDIYARTVRLHIAPILGDTSLEKVTALMVQDLIRQQRERGASESTIAQAYTVLTMALRQAVRWQLISRNPCEFITPPRVVSAEPKAWNAEQIQLVRERMADEPIFPLVNLDLLTTMRRGELLGLRWEDVDFEQRVIRVRSNLRQRDNVGAEMARPKTAASVRDIPMRRPVVDLMQRVKREQNERRLALGPSWHDLGFCFDSGDGQPRSPSQTTKEFGRMLVRLDLPVIRFHDLRHTAITDLLRNGLTLSEVGRISGHSTVFMVAHYQHIATDELRERLDRIDEVG